MKVKLLKKVRKRFDIIHHPKGIFLDNVHFNHNLFELIDNDKTYWQHVTYVQLGYKLIGEGKNFCNSEKTFNTEAQCINYLKKRIIERLRSEGHRSSKDNKITNSSKKVWYNG